MRLWVWLFEAHGLRGSRFHDDVLVSPMPSPFTLQVEGDSGSYLRSNTAFGLM